MITSRRQLLAASAALALPARLHADVLNPTASELGAVNMARIADDVWVKRIGLRNWLMSATAPLSDGSIYPSNGLIHAGERRLVMVDPGWNPAQADALIAFCRKQFGKAPHGAIVTHFHDDRLGGHEALKRAGVPVHMSDMTARLASGAEAGDPAPPFAAPAFGLETFHPGPAHSPDNIVVWEPSERVLFGGCMIKSVTSDALGNLADADVVAWTGSLDRLRARYARAARVIPGHGLIDGDTIGRTRALVEQELARREA